MKNIYEKIKNANFKYDPVIWEDISYEATLFVKSCLMKFPFVRLRTKEALHHPWVKGIKLKADKEDQKPLKKSLSYHTDLSEGKHFNKTCFGQMSSILI